MGQSRPLFRLFSSFSFATLSVVLFNNLCLSLSIGLSHVILIIIFVFNILCLSLSICHSAYVFLFLLIFLHSVLILTKICDKIGVSEFLL